MKSAVALKPTKEKSNASSSRQLREVTKDPKQEKGAEAGIPLFLQRLSRSNLSSPPSLQARQNDSNGQSQIRKSLKDNTAHLSIGEPNDAYEKEADEVADLVTKHAEDASGQLDELETLASQPRNFSQTGQDMLQSKHDKSGSQNASRPRTRELHLPSGGEPLPKTVKEKIEPVLGSDLSPVRIHNDDKANRASSLLKAKAFTHQNHIYLGQEQSVNDLGLMAHEASHVVQQGRASLKKENSVQRRPESSETDTGLDVDEEAIELGSDPEVDELSEQETAEQEGEEDADTETPEEEPAESEEEGGEGDGGDDGLSGGGSETGEAEIAAESGEDLTEVSTGNLALIDEELAEHQRWGAAAERVGEAGSEERAEFIAEAAGGGMLSGLASGAAMGLGMGLVGRAAAHFIPVPGVGGILSGAMSVYGLASRDWSASGATISEFGEGSSTYETLANSIAAIAEIVDIVSNILGVVEGIVGVIQIGVYAITAAAGVATVLTLGAAAPLLASMASLAETLTAISVALGVATTALDLINSAILQPAVLLFRALHAFTSEADPREVEAQGTELGQAAGTIGGAIGGAVGARGAAVGGGRPRGAEPDAPHSRPRADEPPGAATGDGPTVRYEVPSTRSTEAPNAVEGGTRPTRPSNAPTTDVSPPARTQEIGSTEGLGQRQSESPTQHSNAQQSRPSEHLELSEPASTTPSAEHEQLSLPFPEPPSAPRGFVDPENPQLHGTHLYGQPISSQTRASLGHNVQADHIIAQAKLRDMMGPDYEIRAQAEAAPMTPQGQLSLPGIDITPSQTRNYEFGARGTSQSAGQVSPQDAGNWTQIQGHVNRPVDVDNLPPGYGIRRDSDGNIVALPRERGTAVDTDVAPLHIDEQGIVRPGHRPAQGSSDSISHVQGSLTVLAETGRISDTQAYPHTQATFRDTQADVPEIARLRSEGGPSSHSSDLVDPSMQSRQRSGYENESAVNQAMLDQMGRAFQTRRMGERSYVPLEDAHGMPILDASGQPRLVPLADAQGRPVESVADRLAELQRLRGEQVEDIPDVDEMNWSDFEPEMSPPSTPAARTEEQLSLPFGPHQSAHQVEDVSPGFSRTTNMEAGTSTIEPVTSTNAGESSAASTVENAGPTTESTLPAGPIGSSTPSMTALQSYNLATRATRMGQGEQQTEREAAHSARFASDAQGVPPGVERVNPDYPSPPGTPQQLEAIQQEIENILAARAQSQRAASQMEGQERILENDQAPIQQAIDGAEGGISAVQAHEEAVARREQVNQEQQQRQQEAGGLVAGYPSRATGLATLTVPLGVFEGFTGLASHLPGDAGAAMADMNRDARRIQDAFTQMASEMAGQEEAQPARQEELVNQQSRLGTTEEQANASEQSVEQSKQDAQNLQQENEARLTEARNAKDEANQQEQQLDEAASVKQEQADTLTEQLQTWATQHKDARSQAVEATANQLESQGYVILEKNEG